LQVLGDIIAKDALVHYVGLSRRVKEKPWHTFDTVALSVTCLASVRTSIALTITEDSVDRDPNVSYVLTAGAAHVIGVACQGVEPVVRAALLAAGLAETFFAFIKSVLASAACIVTKASA
jgi:hypothetical protein